MMKSNSKLANISTADLRAELDQIISDTQEWIERAAELLVELRARRESHPLMQSNVLRFYRDIADRRLSTEAVLSVGGNRNIVKFLKTLPVDKQADVTKGEKLDVVERRDDGSYQVMQRHILHLDQASLNQVFGDTGLRSIEDQKAILAAAPVKKNVNGFTVDVTGGRLVIANRRISPLDLVAPLRALGFTIQRDDSNKGEAA